MDRILYIVKANLKSICLRTGHVCEMAPVNGMCNFIITQLINLLQTRSKAVKP